MKNGYYLSVYLHVDELAHLIDLEIRHDQNASLWYKSSDNIQLIHHWELERSTGIKMHGKSFYNLDHLTEVMNQLLSPYGLTLDDMNEIWGLPQFECDDLNSIVNEYPSISYHSLAHLYSSVLFDSNKFYNENILGIAVDGAPDGVLDLHEWKKKFYAGCIIRKGVIEKIFPVYSPGFLWIFAKDYYKLREGTLMALASASSSEFLGLEHDLVLMDDNNSLSKAEAYFKLLLKEVENISDQEIGVRFNGFDQNFSVQDNKISMVMKEIQKMSIKIMEYNVERAIEKYDINTKEFNLSLAGGYVLNCPTNSHLMKKYRFKGFIANPGVSDCGLSIGMALHRFNKKENRMNFYMQHAFYGDKDNNLEDILKNDKYAVHIKSVSKLKYEEAVNDIIENPLIWFNDSAEVGPRALGNRSILGDPRSLSVKDSLNIMKDRQWWRPIAPIVLEEDINEWFEEAYPSPFMLHTFKIREAKLSMIPAIAHLDLSSRVQTMNPYDNESIYLFIKHFKEITGVPIICNTSLNDRGEPIINRITEAINFALRKNIKVMYINGTRIELCGHESYFEHEPAKRKINFPKYKDETERKELIEVNNPYNLSATILRFYYKTPELMELYDLTKQEDVIQLERFVKKCAKRLGFDGVLSLMLH